MKKDLILIVDDSPVQKRLLQSILESNNYEVISAKDGEEALAMVDQVSPSLIITDIIMPNMDGYELCRQLRMRKINNVPIILLTILSNSDEMIRGLTCGADCFINKPYNEEYLITLVDKTIKGRKQINEMHSEILLPVTVADTEHFISVNPKRTISFMISAYESALNKNKELLNTRVKLKTVNGHLGELSEERLKLSEQNTKKDKLFSIIAHDLKSPFVGFLGLTEIMANRVEECTKDEILTFSREMHENAKNLFKLLQNLLDWALIQKDAMEFNPIEINLKDVISDNIRYFHQSSAQKGIDILIDVPQNQKIYADKEMLNSVLRNLLSNGLKFTEKKGKIIITSKESENGMIEVKLCDNGIGMSTELCDRLFRVGEKVGRKGTAGEDSTGLGLLLCVEFIEKCGGRIWAESVEGVGSTFYFTLPKVK